MCHALNWYAGWSMILAGFLSGAVLGLGFAREGFLGGYTSFRRRILRLGRISLAALGMINLLYALSPLPVPASFCDRGASLSFLAGGVLMPFVCFLTGWRERFRHLFAIPVLTLVLAVILTLIGASS